MAEGLWQGLVGVRVGQVVALYGGPQKIERALIVHAASIDDAHLICGLFNLVNQV